MVIVSRQDRLVVSSSSFYDGQQDRIFYKDTQIADVVIVGNSQASRILALKYADLGCQVVMISKEAVDNPFTMTLEDADKGLADHQASLTAPGRGCWGVGHYPSDFETVKHVMEASFAYMKAFPILAEKLINTGTYYQVRKDSELKVENVRQAFFKARLIYSELYYAPKHADIRDYLPSPFDFYTEINPRDITYAISDEERANLETVFLLAEGIMPFALVDQQLAQEAEPYLESSQIKYHGGMTVQAVEKFCNGLTLIIAENDEGLSERFISSGPTHLNAWYYNNTIIRNTVLETEDGRWRGVRPVSKTIRVKQLERFWIPEVYANADSAMHNHSLRSKFGKVSSVFTGYGLKQGSMIAILNHKRVLHEGKSGFYGFTTFGSLTNRCMIRKDTGENTVEQVLAEIKDVAKTKKIQKSCNDPA
jgi:hypothetical protein